MVGDEEVARAVARYTFQIVELRGSPRAVSAAPVYRGACEGGDGACGNDDLPYRFLVGDEEVARASLATAYVQPNCAAGPCRPRCPVSRGAASVVTAPWR